MIQILEIVFPRNPKIGDLNFLFKVFIILIILSILNPEVWVVLLGGIVYSIVKMVVSP